MKSLIPILLIILLMLILYAIGSETLRQYYATMPPQNGQGIQYQARESGISGLGIFAGAVLVGVLVMGWRLLKKGVL